MSNNKAKDQQTMSLEMRAILEHQIQIKEWLAEVEMKIFELEERYCFEHFEL